MGVWGTSINANDNFMDVFDEFINFYNQGYSVTEITRHLIKDNQDVIKSKEHSHDFWFAIAHCQWECKELDNEVFNKVEEIILSGDNLTLWKRQDATLKTISKREVSLKKFLEKLKTEKAQPRRRVKVKIYNSIFNEGDCLTYKMANGNYGGAFVLSDEKEIEYPKNFIAITNINKGEKPVVKDFVEAFVLFEKYQNPVLNRLDGGPLIGYFLQYRFKEIDFDIEVIGTLVTNKTFETGNTVYGYHWSKLKLAPDSNFGDWSVIDNKKIAIQKWVKRSILSTLFR